MKVTMTTVELGFEKDEKGEGEAAPFYKFASFFQVGKAHSPLYF